MTRDSPLSDDVSVEQSVCEDAPDVLSEDDRRALRSIVSSAEQSETRAIRALLEFGVDRLKVENGHLTRIRPGPGTHTFDAVVNPLSSVQEGETQDLSATYCRKVIAEGGVLSVHDAPNQGWADDPAYRAFPLASYLGTKVLVDDRLYGTVCFVDRDARAEPFGETDRVLVRHLAYWIGYLLETRGNPSEETNAAEQAESAQQQRDLLRRVQELSQVGGWEVDSATGELTWTTETYRIYEVPLDYEPTVESVLDFFPEEARSTLQAALTRCREEGVPYDLDLPLVTAKDNHRWVRARGVPRYDEEGTITHVTSTVQDVTERHQLQRELQLAQNQFRQLVKHAEPITFLIDDEGTLLVSEGEDLRKLSIEPGELVGESVYDLYADEPELLSLLERVLAGETVDTEIQIEGRTFDIWYAPVHDDTGTVAGCVGMAADITERKQQERARKETTEQLSTILEANPNAVFALDHDGHVEFWNPAAERIFGWSEEEVLGAPLPIVPPEKVEQFAQFRDRVLAGEPFQGKEVKRKRKDGRLIDVRISAAPLRDDEDEGTGIMAVLEDVTAQKERERRIEAVFNNTYQFTGLMEPDGTMVKANDTALEFGGLDEDDVIGKPLWETHWAQTGEASKRRLRAAIDRAAGGEFVRYEREIEGKDGRRTADFSIRPVTDDDGEVTMLIPEARDVTERKEREERLQQTKARLEALFENSPDMINVHDADGNLLDPNSRLCGKTGYTEEELTQMKVWDLDVSVDPDAIRRTWRQMETGDRERIEGTYCRKDGSTFPVEVHIQRLRVDGKDRFVAISRDITERKSRIEALRSERDLLDQVFRTSPTAITILDEEGQLVRVSDQARDTLGIEKAEVPDRTFNDPDWHITAPDGGPFPDDELPFVRVRATEEPVYNVEHAIEWPDGTRRLLSINGAPLHDAEGTFVGGVFHLDDITERRNAKRALRKSEQRFRGVFENAALGIALIDVDTGTILEANPALASMLERDRESLRGTHFEEITHPDDLAADRHLYEELVAGHRDQYQLEKRYVRPSGEAFWGRLTVSRRDGPEGMQVVGMIENIDAQRKRKEDLRLFQKMVEQAEDAIVLTERDPLGDVGPEILYANPAFTEMTGYAAEDALGSTFEIMRGPDTDSQVIETMYRRLREGRPAEGEAINYRRDGTPFINSWNVAPVRDESGAVTHLVSVQRDVTEQRRMQERLLEVQEEERRRIDQEIHDEMGGLLTTLQMTVELTRHEGQQDDGLTERLDEIETLVDELSGTVRTISRKLYPSALSSHGLAGALPSLISEIEKHHDLGVTLESDLEEGVRFSSLIERTVCWIANEALVNVARHADTDTARVTVRATDEELNLHIIDEGRGFDATVHDEERLGIEGIQRRIEHLKGDFELETGPGEGTRISASLPLTIASLPT